MSVVIVMSESKDKQEQAGGGHTLLIVGLSFVPIIYLLMIGPVDRLYDQSPVWLRDVIEVVYAPVVMFLQSSSSGSPIRQAIESYVEWWNQL